MTAVRGSHLAMVDTDIETRYASLKDSLENDQRELARIRKAADISTGLAQVKRLIDRVSTTKEGLTEDPRIKELYSQFHDLYIKALLLEESFEMRQRVIDGSCYSKPSKKPKLVYEDPFREGRYPRTIFSWPSPDRNP